MSKANLDRAVTLLMNLAADQGNRRMLREEGAVEALAEVLKVAPVGDPVGSRAGCGARDAGPCYGHGQCKQVVSMGTRWVLVGTLAWAWATGDGREEGLAAGYKQHCSMAS